MSIQEDRLSILNDLQLKGGSHSNPEEGMCAMEAVAYIAGEPHSDHPECVSPVIAAFMRTWNDGLGDEDRDRLLKPYLTKVIGTKSSKEVEDARGWLAVQWQINHYVPTWLDLAGLNEHATFLRELTVDTLDDLNAAYDKISAARSAADSAAYSAARSAARSAAYLAADSAARSAAYSAADSAAYLAADSAARSAAYSAARSAAYSAARSAAYSAARSAACSAACSAAYSAAEEALKPTVVSLQQSASELLDAMLAVGAKA